MDFSIKGFDSDLPLPVYLKPGKWNVGSKWVTFNPKTGTQEFFIPENMQLLKNTTQTLVFNVADSEYYTIFLVSHEKGIYFAKSFMISSETEDVKVTHYCPKQLFIM